MRGTRIGDRLEVTADGRPRSAEVEDDAAAYVYTPMTTTRSGQVVRACSRPAWDGTSDGTSAGKEECFESRVR